ncbi:cation diffusion facilitator family transporter [Pedobacter gandavensis]|uniref:cation diffusion facilitator family transporter n=1 Tax=Pedobacter TaxID=84567 RepID=UPI001C993285|nr:MULTISPECIES: cation diffusion facilitator family transporter [Pedobacter]WGQ11954.1 cation diffusion facilitator family transporter [Pedobacter gandavensis]
MALTENRLIKLSIYLTGVFAFLSICFGLFTDAKAIIFDGLFSLIGMVLSIASIFALRFIRKPEDQVLPYGRAHFEPFIILIQCLVIIFLCLYSLITASLDFMHGGRIVDLDVAIGFLIFSALGSLVIWLYFRRKARKVSSEFVRIEALEWQLGAFLSVAILVGMVIAFVLDRLGFHAVVPYIDPTLVILASLVFLIEPIKTGIRNLKELLLFAPDDEVERTTKALVQEIVTQKNFLEVKSHIAKTGKYHLIEIDFLLPEGYPLHSVDELDLIRAAVYEGIKNKNNNLWLTISFTAQRKWML